MKNIVVFILIIVSIGVLILNKQYSLTGYKIPLFSVPNGHIRIDFVNKSDKNIQSILLFPNVGRIENIKVGERRTITFEHSGEGTYQFVVNFDYDNQIKESERYIESGYFITENIYNNEVKTNY